MADDLFDALTRTAAKAATRREMLHGLFATAGGALLMLFGGRQAYADPQTCVVCTCGTGRPCNPKSTTCTELRGFPADQACTEACERRGQNLCSSGNAFHCPRGCAA
jgi:hypothetical protein